MLQKIKNVLLAASVLLVSASSVVGLATTAAVPAFADNVTDSLCNGVNQATGVSGCANSPGTSKFSLGSIATSAVNIFSWVVGIVAVIMIIVGGFRYITSGGSSDKISSAKNTLIYAIIGLIIVALAQFIVHYVVSTAQNGSLGH